jgi:hypothetical protein
MPGLDDITALGEFFKAQTVIQGDIQIDTSSPGAAHMNMKLVAMQTANGRVVGEVTRNFDASAGDSETAIQSLIKRSFEEAGRDLVAQIFETWTRGTFGASVIKISLRGRPNYQELETFKRQVAQKVGDIKSLKERRFEPGTVVFEAETAATPQALGQKFQNLNFEGFKISFEGAEQDRVELRWTKSGG